MFFKIAQKVTKFLGFCFYKISFWVLLKIAQGGHTGLRTILPHPYFNLYFCHRILAFWNGQTVFISDHLKSDARWKLKRILLQILHQSFNTFWIHKTRQKGTPLRLSTFAAFFPRNFSTLSLMFQRRLPPLLSFVFFLLTKTFCWHCRTTSHSTTSHRATGWNAVVTLLYDLGYWPCHFRLEMGGWEQITTFSLAKHMNIMHIAFTRDNDWLPRFVSLYNVW